MRARPAPKPPAIDHTPSGIDGLDEVTSGGLPRGRTTLLCGGPGSGKTLFAIQFLVNGAERFDEPGVLISFEESPEELAGDVAALGWDLPRLIAEGRLVLDFVSARREDIEQTGDYDLSALFVRLDYAIRSIGARRVVLDTPESLFAALGDTAILRSEMSRLFRWLRTRGVTSVVTAEAGDGTMTRHGLEEYVSDAVIMLDHRVNEQMATRRLRVVKFRGAAHGTNEYPFLIDQGGFSVIPITAFDLGHTAPTERVSIGVPGLDRMLGGEGLYRASTVMVAGGAGTGKTTIAAHAVAAACRRGERALYLAFEESEAQILRNLGSVGLKLKSLVGKGLLRFIATRPTQAGLEGHLTTLYQAVRDLDPSFVVVDPITDFENLGNSFEIKAMLVRTVDYLKVRGITALFTSVTPDGAQNQTVSSLIDTWIQLRTNHEGGRWHREVFVLKSRGMAHSHDVREFTLSARGIQVVGAEDEQSAPRRAGRR
ncbi:MAG TPA: circadian clock protein KaiC [Acidimicrobiales bacterium]